VVGAPLFTHLLIYSLTHFSNGKNMTIWTVGHSTRTFEGFLLLLKDFDIELLADIRTFPGSKRYPHFNKEHLSKALLPEGIQYQHFPELGGRRKAKPDSQNTAWRHASFKGYADHMETEEFTSGIERLTREAARHRTAYMCSEAVWWRCHRSLVSDYLKVRGWNVIHILDVGKGEEHPYTSPAKVVQGKLFYD
jgi:uncharacterized protein (DUF488 family)